jgi:hypothetical protein
MRASILAPQRHDRDVSHPATERIMGDDAASPHLVDYHMNASRSSTTTLPIQEQGGRTIGHLGIFEYGNIHYAGIFATIQS